jgi:sucrose phosphorylase
MDRLINELEDAKSLRSRVFSRYKQLLNTRKSHAAFHPHGSQTILDLHPSVFAVERISPDQKSQALCLHNVSAEQVFFVVHYGAGTDLFTGQSFEGTNITLEPYQVLWMKK